MGRSSCPLHIVLFPFMSKGHTIPLLHLAKLLHVHRPEATFTIFTTPANKPFISASLFSISPYVTIIPLPFPTTGDGIPPGVESTDHLPSMSLFLPFVNATEQLQPLFENALENLLQNDLNATTITFLISDGFLYWTHQSASKFNIPRLVFYGMNNYAMTISRILGQHGLLLGPEPDDELIQVPDFPWIRVTKNDIESSLREREGPRFDFVMKCGVATSMSYGLVVNSFYELEPRFQDYSSSKFGLKPWSVGPFCLAEEKVKLSETSEEKPAWVEWLDRKRAEKKPVLYVAFGSQAEISNEQLKEIAIGLEKSDVDFLWALRIKPNQEEVMEGFEERVRERGLVVKGWVDQRGILEHESVQGFLSHCGWNSVIESICASVPILGWPMMAEQHLNARMVVEEIKVGLRVETCDGSVRGFVKREGLSKMVRELMGGETGKLVRERVKAVGEAAHKAVEEGGSSWLNLESLLNELEVMQSMKCNGK